MTRAVLTEDFSRPVMQGLANATSLRQNSEASQPLCSNYTYVLASSVPGPVTKHLQMLMEVVPPEKDPE